MTFSFGLNFSSLVFRQAPDSLSVSVTLPFVLQQAEDEQVPATAIALQRLTPTNLFDEIEFPQESQHTVVILRHIRSDPEQVQLGKRKAEQHSQGLRAITLAAVFR